MTTRVKQTTRTARRLQTRERILGAAFMEFKRCGMADADISAIVAAAGVAHGTFYFHFPSKEHVALELSRREEHRLATELAPLLEQGVEVPVALTEVVHMLRGVQHRFGTALFKEILALHLSTSAPDRDGWTEHPLIVLLVQTIERGLDQGTVHPEVDAFYSAAFFLLGIYGMLSATEDSAARDEIAAHLVAATARGLEVR